MRHAALATMRHAALATMRDAALATRRHPPPRATQHSPPRACFAVGLACGSLSSSLPMKSLASSLMPFHAEPLILTLSVRMERQTYAQVVVRVCRASTWP
eukprot:360908-Chlamydomonas_euryale.AAC.25